MTNLILIYVTYESDEEAKQVGLVLLRKHLCACIKVISNTYSAYFWPPKSKGIIETTESVLLIKTEKEKFKLIEKIIKDRHLDKIPCILSLPIEDGNPDYLNWVKGEVNV